MTTSLPEIRQNTDVNPRNCNPGPHAPHGSRFAIEIEADRANEQTEPNRAGDHQRDVGARSRTAAENRRSLVRHRSTATTSQAEPDTTAYEGRPEMRSAREPARWRGFRSVMCAVDFSERSRQALRYAEAVARRGLGTLTVLYANDPLLVAAAAAALRDGDLVKRSAAELDAFVDETLQAGPRKRLRVRTQVSVGD